MDIAIVGVGNILMLDDGVGVHAARALAAIDLPEGVVVLDAGTDPDAAYELEGANRVIVIDAARGGEAPGTIYRLPERLASETVGHDRTCHGMGLLQTLRDAPTDRRPAEVIVLGIEPSVIDWGLDLSPDVEACLPRVIEIVLGELKGDRC